MHMYAYALAIQSPQNVVRAQTQAWQVTERSSDRPELTKLLRDATEAAQASRATAQGNGAPRATGTAAPGRRGRSRRRDQRASAGSASAGGAPTA
eukprot:scaffold99951_cov63-Phaeocystis_antarctica.AAC.9